MDKQLIGSFHYEVGKSNIYFYPEKKSTIEILELKSDLMLLQGSREYYIKDVYDSEKFEEKYGLEGEYHSRLASVGTFSDYLKEAVPSFDLSLFYINSLSSGIVTLDDHLLKRQIGENEKRIQFKEGKLRKLEFDRESGLKTGKEILSLKSEIEEFKNKLNRLKEEKELNERLQKEYKKKGVGATFILRVKSPTRLSNNEDLEENISSLLDDLDYKNKIIKSQAWQGFKIIIEDIPHPHLAFSSESIGLFDPRSLEELTEQYDCKELEDFRKNIESLFLYRPATNIKIGEKRVQKSSAIAQGIASLMRRAVSKPSSEKELPEPDYSKLPSTKDEKKKLAYMGFILEDGIRISDFPFLYDLDNQGPQHTLIVGGTGSGKTICASNLAEGVLIRNVPVLVLDTSKQWTGFFKPCQNDDMLRLYKKFEMKDIKATGFNGRIFTPNSDVGINLETNLLARPETEKKDELQQCAYEIAAIIKVICNLNSNEAMYVRTVILEEWERGEILDYIKLRKRLDDWARIHDKNVFETKLKLEELEGYPFLFKGENLKIHELWKPGGISVIELSHLADNQKIYTAYFLMRELLSYFFSQPDSSELKLLLIVEEAHRFIPKNTPGIPNELYMFLDRVIRELRRKGVGTVFISQVMTDFRQSIRANTATKIRLRTTYDGDITRANKDIGSLFANYLPKLKTGQGIVSFPDYGNPFFVHFRPPLHSPFSISDEEIKDEMRIFKEKDHVAELLELKVDEIKKLTDKDLRAIKGIAPKIYDVIRSIRNVRGITYAKDLSKLSSREFMDVKEKLEMLSSKKLQALEELLPEVYDIIKKLREIFAIEEEIKLPEEEIFIQMMREFQDEKGIPPKQSDILNKLGWGWKKTGEIVNTLEEQGRIKIKPDLDDKRIKRLILTD